MSASVVAAAIVLDAAVGDPERLWRRTGHPVMWFGRAISDADERFNTGQRRGLRGASALVVIVLLFAVPAWAIHEALSAVPFGWLAEAALASTLLAHKSLHEHVRRVLEADGIVAQRAAVSMIVGRDTSTLDEAGVSRATIETLSESLSDGVVAPAFWLAIAGLPGIVVYKVVNTADSMIGHRTPRHEDFGKAAARVDDALNFVPARLTAFLVGLAVPRILGRWRKVVRDAKTHVSPNAGWPEAAFARALGVMLGGPRRYGDRVVQGHRLNARGRTARLDDISRGLRLSLTVGVIQVLGYTLLAAI